MQPEESNGQAVRRQLERVLSSAGFSRNERLSRFLRFVVERHLEGKDSELKESLIAVEIFGRKPDYDPKLDAIVRTEAVRLRERLSKYYAGEGSGDPVIIELPKGGYVPVFRDRTAPFGRGSESASEPRPKGAVWLAAALGLLAVAGAALGWWWVRHQRTPVSIAVLPLENLGGDPANDYFADGLTDEIIRNLSVIEGLAVRSRTSSFALKRAPRNAREAGKQLAADYILEGSVLRAGRQLRINAQLVRVRDDFPLWSGKFDRELTDIFAIQDEISLAIVNQLRLNLGRGRRRYETSVEAYDLYLRARAPQSPKRFEERVKAYEDAIAKDPAFAPAYAGLASLYASRSIMFPVDHPPDQLSKMRAAAEKALQLDPLLAEAHQALGMACARDAQWVQSEKSFRRAIELDPNRSSTYDEFVWRFLLVLGRTAEALEMLNIAERADPLSTDVQWSLAEVLISVERYDEAARHYLRLPEAPFKRRILARIRLGQGKPGEAIEILAQDPHLPNQPLSQGTLGYAYARSGRREEAEKLAAGSDLPNVHALIFAGLGDKDRALEALDRMAALGPQRVGVFLNYPELAFLRGDPRLKALRHKVGLPE